MSSLDDELKQKDVIWGSKPGFIPTKKTEEITCGIECKHDYFALSFTRDADAVDLFRSFLRDNGSRAQIIAKLEDQKGVENISEIIQSADALMVARGDLGIECAFEDLPIIQRNAVGASLAAGKPVIVATHMLESMIDSLYLHERKLVMLQTQLMKVQTIYVSKNVMVNIA